MEKYFIPNSGRSGKLEFFDIERTNDSVRDLKPRNDIGCKNLQTIQMPNCLDFGFIFTKLGEPII